MRRGEEWFRFKTHTLIEAGGLAFSAGNRGLLMSRAIEFRVNCGDITETDADVVALKFAHGFHGADMAVEAALRGNGIAHEGPPRGKHCLVETRSAIAAPRVLFVGVGWLIQFLYPQIRQFGETVLQILAREAPNTRHLAMTVHGSGYGLDETEALLAQVAGCMDALRAGQAPPALERITIVELREARAHRIWRTLERQFPENAAVERVPGAQALRLTVPSLHDTASSSVAGGERARSAGLPSAVKPHAFVAMPFDSAMDDIYYYGIEKPIHAAGLLSERVDQATFSGHILDRIRERIETAAVVIADLTGANPNVYLEVGYAWGKGRPTILLVQDPAELRFDVASQRCLIYKRIKDLETMLAKELEHLAAAGVLPRGG